MNCKECNGVGFDGDYDRVGLDKRCDVCSGTGKMKRIRVRELKRGRGHHKKYSKDVDRIVADLARRGYEVTRDQAILLWELASESVSEEWMIVPTKWSLGTLWYLTRWIEEVE